MTAKGNKIVIKLTQPDGGILAKLGMPFFQALPTNLALDKNGVNAYAVRRPVLHLGAHRPAGTSRSSGTRTTRATAPRTSTRSTSP